MELCQCNLTQYINQLKQKGLDKEIGMKTRKGILLQMTRGLEYLHCNGIVHRDIKPDNILFSRPDTNGKVLVKLGDYGISRQMDLSKQTHFTTTGLGTLLWGAPEICTGTNKLTTTSDVFSLGIVCYDLLSWGDHIFDGVIDRWRNVDPIWDEAILPPGSLERRFIESLIDKDPKQRPTAKDILRHPFFWQEEAALDFIMKVSKALEDKTCHFFKFVDNLSQCLDNPTSKTANWRDALHQGGIDLKKIEQINKKDKNGGISELKKGKSVVDLIAVIRNKATHYTTLTQNEVNIFGAYPEQYLEFWTRRFPKLIPILWDNIGEYFKQNPSISDLEEVRRFYKEDAKTIELTQEIYSMFFGAGPTVERI